MSRSKWKGPYVKKTLLTRIVKTTIAEHPTEFKTTSRNSVILPKFVGSAFLIHNGKTFTRIRIVNEMVGHKLGEFSPTRKRFSFKKKKKKK